jgi:hypothetical protein
MTSIGRPSPYTQTPRFGGAEVRATSARTRSEAERVFGEEGRKWNDNTTPSVNGVEKEQPVRKSMPPDVARAMSMIHAVAPMTIANEDFGRDVNRWRRAARQLASQLYRAKFVLGDLIEDVDVLHEKDKNGELHADELPVDDIIRASEAPQDKEELAAKLKTAEGVIRKLYTKCMNLSNENTSLREENEQLRHLLSQNAARPYSADGVRSRPSTAHTRERTTSAATAEGPAVTGKESGAVVSMKAAALDLDEEELLSFPRGKAPIQE